MEPPTFVKRPNHSPDKHVPCGICCSQIVTNTEETDLAVVTFLNQFVCVAKPAWDLAYIGQSR